MEENIENQESKLINWKSIAVGSIITFIGISFYNGGYFYYYSQGFYIDSGILFAIFMLATVIAGFTVAYINKPIYKVGIVNGLFATIIGLYLSNLFIQLLSLIFIALQNILLFIINIIFLPLSLTVFYIIPVGLLGIFGAFMGTSIKKLKIRINSRQIKA